MRILPILYSPPMVQAVLGNIKKVTRRTRGLHLINNDENIEWVYKGNSNEFHVPAPAKKYDNSIYYAFEPSNSYRPTWVVKCPYGDPGDTLWVRETWWGYGQKVGKSLVPYGEVWNNKNAIASPTMPMQQLSFSPDTFKWYKKPSIHMPKVASRIKLQVVSVKIERLNDITEEEAKNEGVVFMSNEFGYQDYGPYAGIGPMKLTAKESFKTLWMSINGPESWGHNPWVWVIEFKVISTKQ